MSNTEDNKPQMISEAVTFLNRRSKYKMHESEESTEDLVKKHEERGHFDDKPGIEALKRKDLTKDHLKRLFNSGMYKHVIKHPSVDKEMMKGFLDHAHDHFKNDLAQKAVAHTGKEMGLKHPLIDKMEKGELKPKVLNLGDGPSKDYGKGSGSWTGD